MDAQALILLVDIVDAGNLSLAAILEFGIEPKLRFATQMPVATICRQPPTTL